MYSYVRRGAATKSLLILLLLLSFLIIIISIIVIVIVTATVIVIIIIITIIIIVNIIMNRYQTKTMNARKGCWIRDQSLSQQKCKVHPLIYLLHLQSVHK